MKKKIILLAGLIVFVMVAYAGFSYAIFESSKVQENSNQITTYNCLEVIINGGDELNLTNSFPIQDEEGILQKPYTFTVTNNCNHYVGVDIGIDYQSNSNINPGYIKATLNKHNEGIMPRLLSSYEKIEAENENNKYVMIHEGLPAGDSQTYEYRMWIDYSVENIAPSSTFNGKIFAIGTVKTEEAAPKNWYSAGENTLLLTLRNNNSVRAPWTTPGASVNKVNESVLASTTDDYGTSFYFRGNVQNNYVLFAGKCWRIVRIDGNGNIKLFLWDNSGTTCTSAGASSSKINNSNSHVAYIGLMYGDTTASEYSTIDEKGYFDNITDSEILKKLKSWYDTAFKTSDAENPTKYTDLLADVIWCNSKGRSYSDKPKSLICQNYGYNNLNKFTAYDTEYGNGKLKSAIEGTDPVQYKYYKIGLVTFEEELLAGAKARSDNTKYYLYTGGNYWTLSPDYYSSSRGYWRVYPSGYFMAYYDLTLSIPLRPSISLIPTVTIENNGADGTKSNPYIIGA